MRLVVTYRTQNNFRHFCGVLDDLVSLPTTGVSVDTTHLRLTATGSTVPVDDYVDLTYVHGHYKQGRAQVRGISIVQVAPLYPVHTWNVHNTTLNDDSFTHE